MASVFRCPCGRLHRSSFILDLAQEFDTCDSLATRFHDQLPTPEYSPRHRQLNPDSSDSDDMESSQISAWRQPDQSFDADVSEGENDAVSVSDLPSAPAQDQLEGHFTRLGVSSPLRAQYLPTPDTRARQQQSNGLQATDQSSAIKHRSSRSLHREEDSIRQSNDDVDEDQRTILGSQSPVNASSTSNNHESTSQSMSTSAAGPRSEVQRPISQWIERTLRGFRVPSESVGPENSPSQHQSPDPEQPARPRNAVRIYTAAELSRLTDPAVRKEIEQEQRTGIIEESVFERLRDKAQDRLRDCLAIVREENLATMRDLQAIEREKHQLELTNEVAAREMLRLELLNDQSEAQKRFWACCFWGVMILVFSYLLWCQHNGPEFAYLRAKRIEKLGLDRYDRDDYDVEGHRGW